MFNYSQKSEISQIPNSLLRSKNLDRYIASDSKTDTIVIADEDPEVQDALSVAVRQWAQDEQRSVKIIVVEDGQQAIDYVKARHKNPPLLVILDLHIPKKNGLQSAEEINKLFVQIPIIMTTSHDENDEQLIKQADDFAYQNSHIGFIIRTNSLPLLKVTLESELKKLFSDKKRVQENPDLLNTFQGALSQLLSKIGETF